MSTRGLFELVTTSGLAVIVISGFVDICPIWNCFLVSGLIAVPLSLYCRQIIDNVVLGVCKLLIVCTLPKFVFAKYWFGSSVILCDGVARCQSGSSKGWLNVPKKYLHSALNGCS